MQVRMEFWPALLASRPGFEAFRAQHPDVYKQLLDNVVNSMGLVATEALAASLHTLYMVRMGACICTPHQWLSTMQRGWWQ
jgi:hypothetical protein